MRSRARQIAQAAIIAALYTILTQLQNLLLPGSATWALQMRLSEALCVLAFFTPAAAPGLAAGCFLFNLTFSAALPLDLLLGPAATWLAARAMWHCRRVTVLGLPLPGLWMPALCNGLLVGWGLTLSMGGTFVANSLYVAAGELAVMMTLGTGLYAALRGRRLAGLLFGPRS